MSTTAERLILHLAKFESLITMPPDQIMKVLTAYIDLFTDAGRFIILLFFTAQLVTIISTVDHENFKASLLPDIYRLCVLMVLFGNATVYGKICEMVISMFNVISENILQSQIETFKSSFRGLINALADESKKGIDFFNIKGFAASALTMFLSIGIFLLIITYYIFVSFGMFQLLIVLAVGPVIAGFYFFMKAPFFNWLNAIFASLTFPITIAITMTIINEAGLVMNVGANNVLGGIQGHMVAGSVITCLIQILLCIAVFHLIIVFHGSIWGVPFINIPVRIISAVQMVFGMFHGVGVEVLMKAVKKKGK